MVFSAIPQVVTEDRASGAQVVDGSLKFDGSKSTRLTKTFASAGNRTSWTWSCWVKRDILTLSNRQVIFGGYGASNDTDWLEIGFDSSNDKVYFTTSSISTAGAPERRDPVGWYHFFSTYDGSNLKIYVNNNLDLNHSFSGNRGISNNTAHYIGQTPGNAADRHLDGRLSQCYFVDGQVLNPSDFAYTDPLTNTWRPKKYDQLGPNNGTTWSDNVTSSNIYSGSATDVFDGSYGSQASVNSSDASNNHITLSSVNVVASKVGVVLSNSGSDVQVYVNGSLVGTAAAGDIINNNPKHFEFTFTETTVSTIKVQRVSSTSGWQIYGVSLNGVTLIDGDTSNMGGNGFYLPLDGNTPIGKDQSGKGNDWTPVAFGGSVELPKATGAIPILKTNDSGTVAKGGVRTDKKTYTVTASGGNYYLDGALKPTLNAYRGGSYTFDYTGATSHPFYLSSLPDGKHNSKAYSVQFDGSGDYLSVPSSSDFDFGSGDCTVECFVYITSHAGDKTIIGSWEGTTSWQLSYGADSGNDRFAFMMHDGSSTLAAISSFQSTNYVNQWVHLAGVRHGNWLKVYVNGIFGGERSISGAHTTFNAPLTIGGRSNGNQVTGYVSNVRVVKGTALYTAAFVPPSTTLTNVTGTTLLCCQENNAATAAVIPSGSITVSGNAAASQSRHPFLYDNNHGNFGLNLATSNTTKITIPHTAADTLYYYCNAHSGMGSSINVTTDIFKADPYAWKCMFAMASDTIDHSPEINVNSTASIFGDIHTTTPQPLRNLYGHSKKMETGGGFRIDMELTTAAANAKHQWGTGDFTVECWHYQDGGETSWQSLFRSASYNNNGLGSIGISHYANGETLFPYWGTGGGAGNWGQTGNVVPYKKWHHTAWTRQGGVNRIFANGVIVKTFNDSRSYDNKGFEIGDVYTWNGGYQDARIYNGVAKYTENFVVPATEPDVLPDSPSGITGKTNLTKIAEGAVSFDGSGDYLEVTGTSDVQFGTGAFTAECFVYANSLPGSGVYGIFDTGSAVNANRFSLVLYPNGKIYIDNNTNLLISTHTLSPNTWNHIAFVREGTGTNEAKLYINGVLSNQATINTDFSNDDLLIGKTIDNLGWNGYISNVRIVKGRAVYTSNFTPPAAPLTNVTNTKLLCCQSNTSANVAAVSPNISGLNNGTVWSSYFTGNHDSTHGWDTLYKASNAFDGNLSTMAIGQVDAEGLTWTAPGGGIGANATTIRIYGNDDNCPDDYLKINGINYGGLITQGFGPDWTVLKGTGAVGGGITQLESVYLRDNSAGNQHYRWRALEIDGTVIVDPVAAFGDAVATNFNPFTDDINTIRGQASGYATWNPLTKGSRVTLSNGNLDVISTASTGQAATMEVVASIGTKSGKYYVEWTNISNRCATLGNYAYGGTHFSVYDGGINNSLGGTTSGGSFSFTSSDFIAFAVDFDNKIIRVYKNNLLQYTANYTTDVDLFFKDIVSGSASGGTSSANFGQNPFKFPPPDGFQPLNLSNVQPEKVIARPDQYVKPLIWSGDNTTRKITTGHHPDLVWIKCRSDGAGHRLFDTVRGTIESHRPGGANPIDTTNTFGAISAYHNDGFTLTPGSYSGYESGDVNMTGRTYLGWSWKAGGGSGATSGEYWIDDKQYADATAAGLNVGAFNDATYNQDQNWGSLMSVSPGTFDQSPNFAFNGFISGGSNRLRTSDNNATVTMDLSGAPVTVSSQIKVIGEPGYTSSCTVTVGGVTYNSSFVQSTGAHTFNVSGSLTQMVLTGTSSGGRTYMEQMEIDGKILVNSGTTINAPSIAPTGCSVGTKQGFSILRYNGAASNSTLCHGLSQAPDFIIIKNHSGDTQGSAGPHWYVKHKSVSGGTTGNDSVFLNLTNGQGNNGPHGICKTYGDSLLEFVDGSTNDVNWHTHDSAATYSCYAWHDVPGLQKFGSYVGNTNEGPFVELGFRPAILWIKCITQTWYFAGFDAARNPYNPNDGRFIAFNNNGTESSGVHNNLDFLSNGFRIRSTSSNSEPTNLNGQTYIYCAWAEAPSINLYGAQSNAR